MIIIYIYETFTVHEASHTYAYDYVQYINIYICIYIIYDSHILYISTYMWPHIYVVNDIAKCQKKNMV